jgi:signal transduction histidine kinase
VTTTALDSRPALSPLIGGASRVDHREVTSGLRMRVLLPLLSVLLVLVTLVAILLLVARVEHGQEQAVEAEALVKALLKQRMEQQVNAMGTFTYVLMRDPKIQAAFLARDSQALLALTRDLLDAARTRHAISRLYFILPDRTVLLRSSEPAQSGDRTGRFVQLAAERTGKPASGNEEGPQGAYTQDLATPWRVDGKLIGYIELGTELEDLLRGMGKDMNGEVLILLDKHFLDEAGWTAHQRSKSHPVAWNEFRDVVVVGRPVVGIPQGVRDYLQRPRAVGAPQEPFETLSEGRTIQVLEHPLPDATGQPVGSLLAMTDLSSVTRMWHISITGVVLTFALVGGGLMFFFSGLMRRVQADVTSRSERLHEAQAKLLTEQVQRQGTQRELMEQQERNHLLEARSRMVEELADAKRTAEAALSDHQEITAKLRGMQSELVATALQAGRAEIATNVLHNVGNILNSINTSASVIGNTLRQSRLAGLTRALELLRQHGDDLGGFFTRNEKGKMLPGYLSGVAQALSDEQRDMGEEVARLVKSIQHVKDIVAIQQSHAVAGRVLELLQPAELAEEALRMQSSALTRHRVTVVREFQPVPSVPLDRGRILQILVNLISNAKNAMSGLPADRHRLILRIELPQPDRLRISVRDEGEGIPPENLTRIFAHGFTTRRNGHGFGLHSSALAAREMGGTLAASSEGPGEGATFTLELPLDAPADRARHARE